MRNLILRLLAVSQVFISGFAIALEKSDFQFNSKLEVKGNHPVYKTLLPFEVYKGIRRNDLGDLRVFNSDGVELPHAIRNVKTRLSIRYRVSRLPIFPIRINAKNNAKSLSVFVKKNSSGTIVRVNSNDAKANVRSKISMVIVDASKLRATITALKFDWTAKSQTAMHSFLVERSNDLKRWSYVSRDTLTKLNYLGHKLDRHTINFSGQRAKYYRITWPNDDGEVVIKSIRASYHTVKTGNIITRRSRKLTAYKVESPVNDANYIYFKCDTGALPPIDRIKIALPYNNMAIKANIMYQTSRWEYDRHGRKRGKVVDYSSIWSGLLYKIKSKHTVITNRDIRTNLLGQRVFYIKFPRGSIPSKLKALDVNISWKPHRLLFIAQGEQPYTLAYGSGKVEPSRFDFSSLASLIRTTHKRSIEPSVAVIQTPITVASFKGPVVVSDSTSKSNRWILWGVMLLGVVFLGFMTRRISKQMSETK